MSSRSFNPTLPSGPRCDVRRPLVLATATIALLITGSSLGASETDDRIEAAFGNTYVCKTYLKDDAVKIVAKDGVVTLTGTVNEDSHKALAEETAASLPGVTRVDNLLATRTEAGSGNADKWIGRKVKLTLLFHRHVDASKTIIEVKDGIVTLKGEAANSAQKELTAEYAKDIEGVKDVKNEMSLVSTAVPTERTVGGKVDDASITAQVKTALLLHRSTSAIKTRVETRNGEVTLSGIARNAAEKALVSKLADDIQGVTGVQNLMTIDTTSR